jgi:hypothetical protein
VTLATFEFEALCDAFCDVAGIQPRSIVRSEDGGHSITVRLRDVAVTLLQLDNKRPDTVFLIAELGVMPEHRALAGWLSLLNTNLWLVGQNAPAFCRNPETGQVLLQWACPLDSVTATDAYQQICAMADLACQWRQDYLMDEARAAALRRAESSLRSRVPSSQSASARFEFEALYRDLCDLGHPAASVPGNEDLLAFPVKIPGVDVMVIHSPMQYPDCALVLVQFGALSTSELSDVTHFMDANLGLMAECHGATWSREATSGALILQYAFPLACASAQRLLEQLAALARLARVWNHSDAV